MPDYDPQQGRSRQSDSAIDAVFGATDHRGVPDPADGPPDDLPQPDATTPQPVIDLSDDVGGPSRPPSPGVTPDPAPPDDVLVKVGAAGTIAALLVLIWLWRRLRGGD